MPTSTYPTPPTSPGSIDTQVNSLISLLDRTNAFAHNTHPSTPPLRLLTLKPTIFEEVPCISASYTFPTSRRIAVDTGALTEKEKLWITSKSPLFTEELTVPYVDARGRDDFDINLESGLETVPKTRNAWDETLTSIFAEAYDVYSAALAADAKSDVGEKTGLLSGGMSLKYGSIIQGGESGKCQDTSSGTIRRHTGDSPDETEVVATYKMKEGEHRGDKRSMDLDIMFKMAQGI
jgi:hypothetical protein